MQRQWSLRLARETDVSSLEKLIALSARGLRAHFYSAAQIDGALGSVFGVDRQLIRDGTYFVVEGKGELIGCGGWSKRKTLFGSDHQTNRDDAKLDPARDPARIRAFFIHAAGHGVESRARFWTRARKQSARPDFLRLSWSRLYRANRFMLRAIIRRENATTFRWQTAWVCPLCK